MAALRLAQGFQFVLNPPTGAVTHRDAWSFQRDHDAHRPKGASEVLLDPHTPVYLSMTNEIHCLSYNGDLIQVKRYLRRMNNSPPFEYQCLVWPKEGDGYTSVQTSFAFPNLEAYHWNRLDMLIAGYEQTFNDSLRYWRTRFIVLPSDPPQPEEGLNDEEIRLKGADKLADLFSRARWTQDSKLPTISLRFVPTTLGPAACVLDANVTDRIEEVHASGPLQKKAKSERVLTNYTLREIAKAMREEDGVPIKNYKWHNNTYPDAFTGYDLVSWLVREFKDIHTREQAAEQGARLQKQGLFQHCRGRHQFLDGNYFYQLIDEYAGPNSQRGWFSGRRQVSLEEKSEKISNLEMTRPGHKPPPIVTVHKKTLLLSQTCIIDVDPNKRSDQAERVILHHDVIHNPANGFHFELQWLGTTAKCIQDMLKMWNRTIEKNGLKIVEAYVDPITDIRTKNVFQSCLPIRVARLPPTLPTKYLYDGSRADNYFECQILKKFDFVLDVEAGSSYSDHVDVMYSYRTTPFQHSQYVHKSGAAFVQVIGGTEGFRWLKNRLVQGEKGSLSPTKEKETLSDIAEKVRARLEEFCADEEKLRMFYDEVLKNIPITPTSMFNAAPTSTEPTSAPAAYHTST
ncbi:hypothetical protein EXIGLDRAFT_839316 [Exidia glandulosa HHB12029]|uniref:Vacuolar membrane-associated protein IML1 n=1 Tax=Exidia glandulosa HHB12029 TaxID=1314781 RepID=A0A165F350_EXIGL|nr:hypothetical protein EXIGLDRAFT_839316 [Exidia glandulosa HHB12029]